MPNILSILIRHFLVLIFCLIIGNSLKANEALINSPADISIYYSESLSDKIRQALISKPSSYQPRTKHLSLQNKPLYTNRLIFEDSPYLLQHAHNPVNWFSWGKDAFAQAKKENKPILLSIGYSTCHWCHVMEEESFENTAVAKILNRNFISIKVDREQRPDIDAIYMQAVQLIAGQGGWPMTVLLTPDAEVIYAGTYYPTQAFIRLLNQLHQLWGNKQTELVENAKLLMSLLKQRQQKSSIGKKVNISVLNNLNRKLLQQFDELQGGFLQAPKFPQESKLLYLIDEYVRNSNPDIFTSIDTTLKAMRNGGFYDQIGGGFHRYSIDNDWLIPHFEKMLYNQAHLSRIYLQFYQWTMNEDYLQVAKETIDYALNDLRTSNKKESYRAFYAASDADSEGEEGIFFLWNYDELKNTLNLSEFDLVKDFYGVTVNGNYTEGNRSLNILTYSDNLDAIANKYKISREQLLNRVTKIKSKLNSIREKRIHPHLDKKVLTSWNAMMVTTLSTAFQLTHKKSYLKDALSTINYLYKYNHNKADNEWYRSSLDGQSTIPASQNDYAYLSQALISLYDVTNNIKWLDLAVINTQHMIEKFEDIFSGGFYMDNPSQSMSLAFRPKDGIDGAIPSGNSIAYEVLSNLVKRMGGNTKKYLVLKKLFELKANELLSSFSASIIETPTSYSYMLKAVSENLNGEISPVVYGANGHLKASIKSLNVKSSYSIKITIDEGWHINSAKPLDKSLIKTSVSLDDSRFGNIKVDYPQGIAVTNLNLFDSIQDSVKNKNSIKTLSLYESVVDINLELIRVKEGIKPLLLNYQACSQEICLKPESLVLYVLVKTD